MNIFNAFENMDDEHFKRLDSILEAEMKKYDESIVELYEILDSFKIRYHFKK